MPPARLLRQSARRAAAGAACAALFVARLATAQDLVTNGNFDTSIDGWAPGTVPSWLDEDWQGDPASGSLRIVNDSATATSVLVSQCVTFEGAEPLVFAGAFRGALEGEATGRVRIGVSWRGGADCAFGPSSLPYLFAVTVDAPTDWIFVASEPAVPPDGAVSADVQLIASKTSDAGTLTADFDAISVPEPAGAALASAAALAGLARRRARSA